MKGSGKMFETGEYVVYGRTGICQVTGVMAISWGGDSDTIGAIVGSMAEALWGIPDSFIWNALRILPDDMRNVIGCFYNTKIEVI